MGVVAKNFQLVMAPKVFDMVFFTAILLV